MNFIKDVFASCDEMFYKTHESNRQVSLDKNSDGLFVIKTVEYKSNYRFNKVEQLGNLLAAPGRLLSNNEKSFTTGRYRYLKTAAAIATAIILFPLINLAAIFQYLGARYNTNGDKLSTAQSAFGKLKILVKMYNDTKLSPKQNELEKLVLKFNQNIQSMVLPKSDLSASRELLA